LRVIGIDPGANGALVSLLAHEGINKGKLSEAKAYPLSEIARGQVSHYEGDICVYIERTPKFVAGNDRIPLSAMCTLYGSYKYFLGMYDIAIGTSRVIEVIPQKWQRAVCGRLPRLGYLERKRFLCEKAKELVRANGLNLKVTLKNCDAFLIAYYGAKHHARIL
jgi:hypothetical protein